jgi:hypothetical protein
LHLKIGVIGGTGTFGRRLDADAREEDLGREYQDWVTGAFQRVTDDGLACQQLVGAFSALLLDAAPQQQPEKMTSRQPERGHLLVPRRRALNQTKERDGSGAS